MEKGSSHFNSFAMRFPALFLAFSAIIVLFISSANSYYLAGVKWRKFSPRFEMFAQKSKIISSFADYKQLPSWLVESCERLNFTKPTDVQLRSLPVRWVFISCSFASLEYLCTGNIERKRRSATSADWKWEDLSLQPSSVKQGRSKSSFYPSSSDCSNKRAQSTSHGCSEATHCQCTWQVPHHVCHGGI